MPPGFRVEMSELDGPVFADAKGRTLYRWPYRTMRNGVTGDSKGESNCADTASTESAGLMSPYPGGLLLPEREKRPSCQQMWPPAFAADSDKAVGKWTVVRRRDGRMQWAYDGSVLYTSIRDRRPGDVLGGDSYRHQGDAPAVREPIQPRPDVPPGLAVSTTLRGRLLQTARGLSVYAFDRDTGTRSACDAACEQSFIPVQAPAAARPRGDWSIFTRESGERQWTFRGKPLYRYAEDPGVRSVAGSDVPGWRNVYTQEAPPPPEEFTVQDTPSGQVLADARGRTLYSYTCGDDAPDQLSCESSRRHAGLSPRDVRRRQRRALRAQFSVRRSGHGRAQPEPAVERRRDRSRDRPFRRQGPAGRVARLGLSRAPGLHVRRRCAARGSQRRRAGRIPVGARRVPRFLVARRFLQPVTER